MPMRSNLAAALLTTLILGQAAALAGTRSSASCRVRVRVVPNVAVTAVASDVDAGLVRQGDVRAICRFRVDANQDAVSFFVEASDLHRADDPFPGQVAPIPLKLSAGAILRPENARPADGEGNVAGYVSRQTTCNGFATMRTRAATFSSGDRKPFQQEMAITVTWAQDDPEKPPGEYSGRVKLTAVLMPRDE